MDLLVIYEKICNRGQVRVLDKSIYKEKHHITPVCMGGNNEKSNLTALTAKEHFICHKILCEIYPENEKLRYAFWAMCNQRNNRNYIVSAREYNRAKKLCLEMWKRPKSKESILKGVEKRKGKKINRPQNGELNHNYNKKWVTNEVTNECKMINGDIPKGWKLGRVKIGSLGKSSSTGKVWYHKDNVEKYFNSDEVPNDWTKGRLKKGKLQKKTWFYSPELNIEKLLTENEMKNGFIKGRLPKLPFEEKQNEDNTFIRTFNSETNPEHFVWHRDREDRIIESIGETDWQIQLDNELPMTIKNEIFIPMGVYHRVIKGTGDLKIKLQKL